MLERTHGRAPGRTALLAASALLGLAGCASLQAKSTFSRGVKARDRGDLPAAIAAFEEANRKDPKPEYAKMLRATKAEVARGEVDKAELAERGGDFATAARHWGAALELAPDNPGLRARKGLAEVEARRPDPVERRAAIAELAKLAPEDRVVRSKLQQATSAAVQYHLRMARMYRDVRSWRQAFRAYEDARALDPDHPIFEGALYRDVKVRELETVGDQALAAGDTLAAYEAYQAAVEIQPSRRMKAKMRRARRGAGPIIEQLRQAETSARLGKWEDAAEIYSVAANRKEASPEIRAAAKEARAQSARIRAERAAAYASRGLVDKAVAELRLALDHTDGAIDAIRSLVLAVDALDDERPAAARPAVSEAERLAPSLPVVAAAQQVTARVAARLFARAQARAKSAPAEALLLVSRLEPFAGELPGYAAARKELVKTAFLELLSSAESHAAQGRFSAAVERLVSASSIAKPPPDLARALDEGVKALEAQDWLRGRAAFAAAVEKSQRSRLAKAGLAVAEQAHLVALRREAAEARAVEDPVRASAAYRDILELDPDDEAAKAALQDLRIVLVGDALSAASAHAQAGRLGAAFVYYHRILTLDPEHPEAQKGLASIRAKLSGSDGPSAWVAPLGRAPTLGERCRGVERAARDRLALYLNKTPDLGVAFLEGDALEAVDDKKSPAPPVELSATVTSCTPSTSGGTLAVKVALSSGPTRIFEQDVSATFDPNSVPKDELEDGLAPRRVVTELLGQVAKEVSLAVKTHADRLAGWRVHLAQDRMTAGDAEGAALAYASLVDSRERLSTEERTALDALERYLNNRFR